MAEYLSDLLSDEARVICMGTGAGFGWITRNMLTALYAAMIASFATSAPTCRFFFIASALCIAANSRSELRRFGDDSGPLVSLGSSGTISSGGLLDAGLDGVGETDCTLAPDGSALELVAKTVPPASADASG